MCSQSCVTLCDPMDCSPPGSSVPETLQAQIPEWVVISSSRGSAQPRDWILYHCTTWEALKLIILGTKKKKKKTRKRKRCLVTNRVTYWCLKVFPGTLVLQLKKKNLNLTHSSFPFFNILLSTFLFLYIKLLWGKIKSPEEHFSKYVLMEYQFTKKENVWRLNTLGELQIKFTLHTTPLVMYMNIDINVLQTLKSLAIKKFKVNSYSVFLKFK